MITGGVESTITPTCVAGFGAMKALSTRNDEPERASRPFDAGRDGFVMGEGAGILLLEEMEGARARGARPYAEVVGYGMSGDAFHISAPSEDGDGPIRVMQAALDDAGVEPAMVDHINAHGTSTVQNDVAETAAIHQAIGTASARVAVSSTKSMTGHMLGAAGGAEAIFTILAIRDGIVPPTINLENPGTGCDLDYVPNVAREMPVSVALSNSFGFGGTNGTLVFSRLQD